ncbi:MAG: transglutaminaseTgpA domain-containing protein [Lachnospiraceae bacterium]|nr:transglutaminaseTgpA domain-containing protein [Lachnospiraceae bacterium]MDD3616965.1 transglutaminaseTgpA domain-containing protein [Lachnospiraceae bacterium]
MKQSNYVLYDVESTEETAKTNSIQTLITQILLFAGFLGLLFCFLSDNAGRIVLAVSALLMVVYINIIGRWDQKHDIFRLAPIAVGILAVLINPVRASGGFLFFCNQWIDLWDRTFNHIAPQLQITNVTITARVQIFILLIAVVVVWLHNQLKAKHLLSISAYAVLIIIITALFQLDISLIWICVMIAGWFLCWISSVSNQRKMIKQMITILPALILLLILGIFFRGYTGNSVVENIKQGIKDSVKETRYGSDTLPEGDMTKAYELVGDRDEKTLHLTVKSANEMYLKGFVGGTFDGENWSILPYEDYTNAELAMFQWLNSQNFESSIQYNDYEVFSGNDKLSEVNTVEVENTGANRQYVYIPYEMKQLSSNNGVMNRDYQIKANNLFGEERYSFESYKDVKPTESIVQSPLDTTLDGAADYEQREQVYRTFVYDNYLDITDEENDKLQQVFFSDGDWSDANLYQITEQIRIIFQGMTTYTDTPESYDGDTEFISWLLDDKKQGNSAYYATVATLAFRSAGIPARYAEGYYLSAADANVYNENNETEFNLTQANAHAWVEVYMDGIGWMPIEVVPGFYFAEYTTQQVVGNPQSSVNIVNQTDEEQLQGNTADSLDPSEEQQEEQPPVVQKVIRVVGIILLIALIIWLIHFLILLRYRILCMIYKKKLNQADDRDRSRMRYRHVNEVLKQAEIGVKDDFPYENIPVIIQHYPEIQEFECKRFIELLHKVVFGEENLTKAEYSTIEIFDDKITETVYNSLNNTKKLLMKYAKGLI